MHDILKLFIPMLALSIPLVAVVGRQIVRPLTDAIARLAEQQGRLGNPRQSEAEMAELHARLERMERVLSQVIDEQQFQRALQEGSPGGEARSAAAGVLPVG